MELDRKRRDRTTYPLDWPSQRKNREKTENRRGERTERRKNRSDDGKQIFSGAKESGSPSLPSSSSSIQFLRTFLLYIWRIFSNEIIKITKLRSTESVDDDQVERNERDEGPKGVRSPALKRKRFFPSLNPSLYLTFLIPQASIPAAPLRSYSDSQRSQVTVQRESMRIPNGPVLEFHCRATLLFAMTPQSQYSRRFTDVSNYASDGTLIIFILYKRWRTDSFPSSTFSLIEQSP